MKKIIHLFLVLFICLFAFNNTQAQIINIPDANFKTRLLASSTSNDVALDSLGQRIKIDINGNNEVEQSEALRVYKLVLYSASIRSLTGISSFTNIRDLSCTYNEYADFDSIDVSDLTNLKYLDCSSNELTYLNITGCRNLTGLNCSGNNLSSLDVSMLTNLDTLRCDFNKLTTLNVSGLSKLKLLWCDSNKLTSLNVSGLNRLFYLDCSSNQLTSLNVNGCSNLDELRCGSNQLTSLDVSKLSNLRILLCYYNRIRVMYLKGSGYQSGVTTNYDFSNNPLIQYICTDLNDVTAMKSRAIYYGYPNTIVNSFCSSTSADNYNTLNGNTKYDADNNGCSLTDPVFKFLQIKIKNAVDSGFAYSDAQGNFAMNLDSGSYTITPQLYSNYFIASPTSTTVTFPEDSIPQQICIRSNGIHHDVSVALIPIRAARPGFSDAKYKIILKNKGNQIENGTVSFNYTESNQDYVSATQVPSAIVSGKLTFNFSSLQVFEAREITVTMRTNAPTDNPSVNAGDVLTLFATASTSNVDEFLNDNTQQIRPTVVGSIDPNDKTCLEGKVVSQDIIGGYVNYLIRFENTGTANAENIVVTDFIDLSKYIISTLEITSTSHSCKTLISNGNKVQFVFDNINLPFTDPNKYGYVAFKIKTKSNLIVGDSLKNSADIYFDYNLPIKTNTATTKITNLILAAKNNSTKDGSLQIYPNPSSGNFTIHFESKGSYPISVKVMDLKGSTVFENNINHSEKSTITVDESNLSDGIYLINITSGKDNWMQKVMIIK